MSLFGWKLGFGRLLDLLYGAIGGIRAFGYNSAESDRTDLDKIWSTLSTLLGPGKPLRGEYCIMFIQHNTAI